MPLTHPPFMRLLRTRALLDSRFIGALSALLPGGSVLAWSHFVEPHRLEITHHKSPLPSGGPPLRILHLSDLHFTREDRWARGIVEQLSDVACDVMVITGDLIHRGVVPDEVVGLLRDLPRPPLGRFVSPGNWDRWGGPDAVGFQRILDAAQLHLLTDEMVMLEPAGRRIALVGMDDLLSGDPDPQVLRRVEPGCDVVALSHTPTLFPALAAGGAHLVLSGHTHGGQIRLPFKGAVWMPVGSGHYDAGWFSAGPSRLFVSRGIGTSVAPLRLLCRPEAAIIEV